MGSLIGLGGPFVAICSTIRFIPDIIAGRGRLALVITALMFAFLDAFQVQGVGVQLPYQLLLALPYVVAILFVLKSYLSV